jgi:hypothetical protein
VLSHTRIDGGPYLGWGVRLQSHFVQNTLHGHRATPTNRGGALRAEIATANFGELRHGMAKFG